MKRVNYSLIVGILSKWERCKSKPRQSVSIIYSVFFQLDAKPCLSSKFFLFYFIFQSFSHRVPNLSHCKTLSPSTITFSSPNYLKSTFPSRLSPHTCLPNWVIKDCPKLLQVPLKAFILSTFFFFFLFLPHQEASPHSSTNFSSIREHFLERFK